MTSSLPAWAPYAPTETKPWDWKRVLHLHRRAGFAAPRAILQRDLEDGPDAAIGRLLTGTLGINSSISDIAELSQTIGDAAVGSDNPERLKAWWVYRMLFTPDPLGERLTLMWHNHFATSNRKVENLALMHVQNGLMRRHARSPFPQLLKAVVKHPAMLIWLDADSNRKDHPNENLARELLELFTLGIGNYSEQDIRESARALSGWRVEGGKFKFNPSQHDPDDKTVLEHRGKLAGDDLLRLLCEHPATARRIAWRICDTFMGENLVDEAAIDQLAEGLRAHELDIGWAVSAVLRSERFFAEENIGSRVLGPVEYVVGTLRTLELLTPPPSTLVLASWLARMGQDLFYPPNVGGWAGGRSWLSSRAIVARANFANALGEGRLWSPPQAPDLERVLGDDAGRVQALGNDVARLMHLLYGDAPLDLAQDIADRCKSADCPLQNAVVALLSRPEYHLA